MHSFVNRALENPQNEFSPHLLPSAGASIASRKRNKLSTDERLRKSRERNRLHARKTRERKKNLYSLYHTRIEELQTEGEMLRQLVDERYTASSLLGLGSIASEGGTEPPVVLRQSSSICGNYYKSVMVENGWMSEASSLVGSDDASATKRSRRSGSYSPLERERLRKERNRLHAKKTRDRKKMFMELADSLVERMFAESYSLREYLLSLGMIDEEELRSTSTKHEQFRSNLARLKRVAAESASIEDSGDDDEADGGEDADGDRERELEENLQDASLVTDPDAEASANAEADDEPSESGSDENEQNSGSRDGSLNADSSFNGDTSVESEGNSLVPHNRSNLVRLSNHCDAPMPPSKRHKLSRSMCSQVDGEKDVIVDTVGRDVRGEPSSECNSSSSSSFSSSRSAVDAQSAQDFASKRVWEYPNNLHEERSTSFYAADKNHQQQQQHRQQQQQQQPLLLGIDAAGGLMRVPYSLILVPDEDIERYPRGIRLPYPFAYPPLNLQQLVTTYAQQGFPFASMGPGPGPTHWDAQFPSSSSCPSSSSSSSCSDHLYVRQKSTVSDTTKSLKEEVGAKYEEAVVEKSADVL